MDNFIEVVWFVLTVQPVLLIPPLFVVGVIVYFVLLHRKNQKEWEEALRAKERRIKAREEALRKSGIYEVDQMPGAVFEEFLEILLTRRGYEVRLTSASGDYGADLILTTATKIIAVQAKRYKNTVGVKAVQEIVGARSYYCADECWVITNNYFTGPARKLANANDVLLIDRDELIELMLEENKGA
ncbi:restriction endonuclease [Peribacillus frigoritolerans]|uniref:restriction endonuclease n=1 Tax=Peribacillus frigoritolerans TaxID=450367 RepID=UPI001F4FB691|nr:restriction endonuclease [Peribacillus frigoritolerans]MCK2018848.1 restriction endonuclease [Peribacillus frigoritolerans]